MTSEIVKVESVEMTTGGIENSFYSSVNAETQEERLELYNAISNPDDLESMIGKKILINDVVMQPITLKNAETGELTPCIRTVLICGNKAYACASTGIETAIKNLFATVGQPTWEPPIPMVVEQKKSANNLGKFYTLRYAK